MGVEYSQSKVNIPITDLPIGLRIPSLGINLPVEIAQVQNNIWPTTPSGVSYLLGSKTPGEIGNSIFYGHNWPRLLGKLHQIKPGEKIVIILPSGTKTFYVTKTFITTSQDLSILKDTKLRQITIYTCYGFADLKRFVVFGQIL